MTRAAAAGAAAEAATSTGRGQGRGAIAPPSSPFHDDTIDYLRSSHRQGEHQRDPGGVWKRVHHSQGTQAAIGVGWRLLHAALPFRARVAYQLGLPLSEGVCEAPGCNCQETLSHAFMDCSKVGGAVDWLLGLFERLTGRRPPRDPRVVLVDDHRVWEPGGEGRPGPLAAPPPHLFLQCVEGEELQIPVPGSKGGRLGRGHHWWSNSRYHRLYSPGLGPDEDGCSSGGGRGPALQLLWPRSFYVDGWLQGSLGSPRGVLPCSWVRVCYSPCL